MPFQVQDEQEFVRLLREHPEWRAAVRRTLLETLSEEERRELQAALGLAELPSLPALVRQQSAHLATLAEAQARTERQLAALTERVDDLTVRLAALTERVDQLAEAQARTERQLAALTERVDDLTVRLAALTERVDRLTDRVGHLDGEVLEFRFRERASAYLSRLVRRLRVLDTSRLADLLDEAVDAGRLSEAERDQAILVDLVATGQRRTDRAEVLLVVEVSGGIGPDDVARAQERAAILARLGYTAMPVVAGRSITAEAVRAATEAQVTAVLDGQTVSA